jgi:hypothetical protein
MIVTKQQPGHGAMLTDAVGATVFWYPAAPARVPCHAP